MWLTERERLTLTGLGVLAVVASGIAIWQQQRPPIGVEPGPTPPYAQWDALLANARTINLNTASAQELERLPDIGPALAQRIVDYRQAHGPFRSLEEFGRVPGIGPKTLDVLTDHITLQ